MKKYFSFLFAIASFYSYGQEISIPDVIPTSPNASSLGEYGQVPVGLFNGTPQINIPLYNISLKGFELPISINYSSNGIKVNEMASNVGLGWDLEAGGVIIRSLNDEDDDYRVSLPNYPFGSGDMNTFLHGVVYADSQDTQPDIFSFNFNGYSGKFYLGNQLTPVLIDPSPLKIERLSLTSFKITDPSGIIYMFGGNNAVENTYTRTYGYGSGADNVPTERVNMAWYLTKIILLGGEEVNFLYDISSSDIKYDGGINQSVSATRTVDDEQNGGYPYYTPATHDLPLYYNTFSRISNLTDIIWKNGNIHFDYAPRFNGISSPNFLRINEMQVHDNYNNLIKKIKFNYDEYNTLSEFNNPDNLGLDNTKYKRLFLREIITFPDNPEAQNDHHFEYYSPDQLPPRLSYAQDYWGYFNGKINPDLVPKNMPYSLYPSPSIAGLFGNVGGDKNSNGIYGIKGLLKKITYPTGGYNNFLYEPHSYWGTEITYPSSAQIDLNPYTNEGDMFEEAEFTTEAIPFRQASSVYHSAGYGSCWDFIAGWPDHKVKAIISVRVADSGSNNFVLDPLNTFYSVPPGCDPLECASKNYHGDITTTSNNGYPQFYIELKEGKRYRFKVKLTFHCINGNFGLDYYDQNFIGVDKNIEVGGLRLKSVISNDGIDQEIKNYHYGDFNNIDRSSGQFMPLRPSVSTYTDALIEVTGYPDYKNHRKTTTIYTLGSNTLNPIYNSQGYHILYKNVVEELGDNFIGGGILHEYNIIYDNPPINYGDHIPGTPYSNGFGNSKEIKTSYFKQVNGNQFVRNKEIINHYKSNDTRKDDYVEGFNATVSKLTTTPYLFYEYNLNKYQLNSHWYYMDYSTTTEYDENENPTAVTTTNFEYDNPDHLQPTRVITSRVGDDKTLITKTDYAHDLNIQPLINQHRIVEPIRVRNYQDKGNGEVLLSTQKTVYDNFGSLYLPKSVQSAKGAEPLQDRLQYHSYDGYGNLREVSQPNGTRIVYVMGYDFTLPVAKLENVTISDIPQSILNEIYAASTSGNETVLLQKLDALRIHINGLSKVAQVTTLTYIPLVGVQTVTDPKGYMMTYKYDDFGRLKYIKDMDDKILSENQYHYIND